MKARLSLRPLLSNVVRRLRAFDRADVGRSAIALLMAAGLTVAALVLVEVRHLSRAADDTKIEGLAAAATVEIAAATYSDISSKIQVVLMRMDDAEIANQEAAAEFHRRQDQLLDRTRDNHREVAMLRAKVEALIAIEEARRETQLRFEKWLEKVETEIVTEDP